MSGEHLKQCGHIGAEAHLQANSGQKLKQHIRHFYAVECYGPDGQLKWRDGFENLVTTDGLNKYLDATLKGGLAAPLWYIGLILGPGASNTYLQADTMAIHAGWTESVVYSNGTRPQWNPGTIAAGSVDNSASKAIFSISGNAKIAGCFMSDNSAKSGGTGTLLGEGNFTGGDRDVQGGDTLNITVTATQS